MTQIRGKLLASVASLVVVGFAATTASADQLLTGSIASAAGQKLEGVLVSAKKEGSTITTSVYTDLNGDYFFPAMADGKYQVWAQTLGFKTAKARSTLPPPGTGTSSSRRSPTPKSVFANCRPNCWPRHCPRKPRPTRTSSAS